MRFFSVLIPLGLFSAAKADSRLQVRNKQLFERQALNPCATECNPLLLALAPCIGLVRACVCTVFIQELAQNCATCLSVEQDLNPSTLLTDVTDFNTECASSGLSITLPKSSGGSTVMTTSSGNIASPISAVPPTVTAPSVGGSTSSSGTTGGQSNQGLPLTDQKTSAGGNMMSFKELELGACLIMIFVTSFVL